MEQEVLRYLILAINDQGLRRMLKVTSDFALGHTILETKESKRAHQYLKTYGATTDVVVYEGSSKDHNFIDLFQYLQKKCPNTHLVLIVKKLEAFHQDLNENGNTTVVEKEDFLLNFMSLIKRAIHKDYHFEDGDEGFRQIKIDSLSCFDGLNTDLYLRKLTGDYIKLFKKGDELKPQDIGRYISQGITYVFIKVEECDTIFGEVSKQAKLMAQYPNFKFILRSEDDSRARRFETKIIRVQSDLVIDEEFQASIESAVNKTIETVLKNPSISKLLTNLNSQEERNYITEHMLLLSYVSNAIAKRVGWQSKSTISKLVFASVLHDITLAGHPHLSEIEDMNELLDKRRKKEISEKEFKLFANHPNEVCDLVNKFFKSAPQDVDIIIRQHHELPNGQGFPLNLNWAKITPLASLFIISEKYVHFVLKKEDKLVNFVSSLKKQFPQSQFRPIIEAFEALAYKRPKKESA